MPRCRRQIPCHAVAGFTGACLVVAAGCRSCFVVGHLQAAPAACGQMLSRSARDAPMSFSHCCRHACTGWHPCFSNGCADVCALGACHCLPFYTWVLSRHSVRPGCAAHRPHAALQRMRRVGLSAGRVLLGNTHPHTGNSFAKRTAQSKSGVLQEQQQNTVQKCSTACRSRKACQRTSTRSRTLHNWLIRLPVSPLRINAGPQENRCLPHHQKATPVNRPHAASHARCAPARQSGSTSVRQRRWQEA